MNIKITLADMNDETGTVFKSAWAEGSPQVQVMIGPKDMEAQPFLLTLDALDLRFIAEKFRQMADKAETWATLDADQERIASLNRIRRRFVRKT